jgi:hypothetical protein
MIPQGVTIFEPVPRILQVNMTFAQVAELPRLRLGAQLNRPFLEQVHTFFRSPRGQTLLRAGVGRDARGNRVSRPAERRTETRTVSKPVAQRPPITEQRRTEQRAIERRPENEPELRR